MTVSYCTLFHSNYLDKGWCMVESLHNSDPYGRIYILCMDKECFNVLSALNLDGVRLIELSQFEDEELLGVKENRSIAEYCWTCTSKLIKYVLTIFQEKICTYVDADMFFYSDPSRLINEMLEKKCTVQVVPHRFPKSTRGKMQEYDSGKNCVQFNTFSNEKCSLDLLDWWIKQCINECSYRIKGDQKYTDDWGKYDFVNISQNNGAGVAPWNITSYKIKNNELVLRKGNKQCNMVFYHFENIVYFDRNTVKIEPPIQYWRMDFKLIKKLYLPYLANLENKKQILESQYNVIAIAKQYNQETDGSKVKLLNRIRRNNSASIPTIIMKINDNIRRRVRANKAVIRINNN